MRLQLANMHFLPSAEVFSICFIFTPLVRAPNKKAAKVSYLPSRPKDSLIFCIILFIPYHWALSSNILKSPRVSRADICSSRQRRVKVGSSEFVFRISYFVVRRVFLLLNCLPCVAQRRRACPEQAQRVEGFDCSNFCWPKKLAPRQRRAGISASLRGAGKNGGWA